MKRKSVKPTESEIEILKVLWTHEPLTVREVFEHLGSSGGYTTVLKFMQIMLEKGLVVRDESCRAHVYRSTLSEADMKRQAVSGLASKLFGGSRLRLAMQALSGETVAEADLTEMRALIDKIERSQADSESDLNK